MVERDLKAIVKRVIQFTRKMNVGRDFWRKASAISGVLAWGSEEDTAVVQAGWSVPSRPSAPTAPSITATSRT